MSCTENGQYSNTGQCGVQTTVCTTFAVQCPVQNTVQFTVQTTVCTTFAVQCPVQNTVQFTVQTTVCTTFAVQCPVKFTVQPTASIPQLSPTHRQPGAVHTVDCDVCRVKSVLYSLYYIIII